MITVSAPCCLFIADWSNSCLIGPFLILVGCKPRRVHAGWNIREEDRFTSHGARGGCCSAARINMKRKNVAVSFPFPSLTIWIVHINFLCIDFVIVHWPCTHANLINTRFLCSCFVSLIGVSSRDLFSLSEILCWGRVQGLCRISASGSSPADHFRMR